MKHAENKTGPRAALAKAIETARDAEAHCQALRASIARIEDERFEARQRLELATAREADQADAHDVIERLVAGAASAAVLEPAVDRKATADAERAIETCNRALALLRPESSDAERSLELRTTRVRDAAGDVVAAEALDKQIAEVERARDEHERAGAVLRFLNNIAPRSYTDRIAAALASSDARGEHASIAPWRVALVALMADANTELPR